jgi:hypothetical protein
MVYLFGKIMKFLNPGHIRNGDIRFTAQVGCGKPSCGSFNWSGQENVPLSRQKCGLQACRAEILTVNARFFKHQPKSREFTGAYGR